MINWGEEDNEEFDGSPHVVRVSDRSESGSYERPDPFDSPLLQFHHHANIYIFGIRSSRAVAAAVYTLGMQCELSSIICLQSFSFSGQPDEQRRA